MIPASFKPAPADVSMVSFFPERTRRSVNMKEITMEHRFVSRLGLAVLLIVGTLFGTSIMAAPAGPNDRGRGPAHVAPQPPRQAHRAPPPHAKPAPSPRVERRRPPRPHFDNRFRGLARDYYVRSYANDRCPSGLSRRGAVCVPSHARAWNRGKPLPRNVIYYDLPARLLVQLPPPPIGYRYARVGGDILMLAIGTGLVVDALMDIFD
jgi:Ni/Co efflux regulator RcnB